MGGSGAERPHTHIHTPPGGSFTAAAPRRPQGFSHLALINAVLRVIRAEEEEQSSRFVLPR